MSVMAHAVDLDRYCDRISYDGPREPTLAVLEHLQSAHAASIPFENIDVVFGRPINVDGASVEEKLVTLRRGGYCFEQNRLFADVLTSIGFEVTEVLARVRPPGLEAVTPRTHMTLCVRLEGADWLADVGFGAGEPRLAVPLDGTARPDGWGEVRVVDEGESTLVLQRSTSDGWRGLYAFAFEPVFPMDYVMGNHFTSTHPTSPFVRGLTLQLVTADVRHVVRSGKHTVIAAGEELTQQVDADVLTSLLDDVMRIQLPSDDRRALFVVVFAPRSG